MNGRRREREAEIRRFWEMALDLWSESGLTVAEFCRREGLTKHTFYAWRRRLQADHAKAAATKATAVATRSGSTNGSPRKGRTKRTESRSSPDGAGTFVPVQVVSDQAACSEAPIEIVLPQGVRLCIQSGFDGPTLTRVLAVLEGRPC
jgi:transposase-like protein